MFEDSTNLEETLLRIRLIISVVFENSHFESPGRFQVLAKLTESVRECLVGSGYFFSSSMGDLSRVRRKKRLSLPPADPSYSALRSSHCRELPPPPPPPLYHYLSRPTTPHPTPPPIASPRPLPRLASRTGEPLWALL
ncbi:hypothetical protein E2C01_033244 [Portunus trituberculatus]|uniref:Uncharacterized protein n=1 Tax=Portunus trituberculatus TaxID=210409 RepID=A0A5B7F389_PORTR|nr:hypothetical protein [Portunus trituberculatus]